MANGRDDWFPTSIWYFDLPDPLELNQHLLAVIDKIKGEDQQGINRSNALGWHSGDNLNTLTEFHNFNAITRQNVLTVGKEIGWDLAKYTPFVANCWANVNGKYATNLLHNHPNSVFSGVYYVQAAEDCGGIFFRDSREAAHIFAPAIAEITPWTLQKVTYKATVGRMILFPSWLMHGVEPNLSESDRISISFNISMTHNF